METAVTKTVPILYFSDVLCVWAYIAHLRIEEIRSTYGDKVRFEPRFCSVFGDTAAKITNTWRGKGEYEGFNAHLRHAAEAFPEIDLNPDIWRGVRPVSSTGPHLFLKAAELAERAGAFPEGVAAKAAWAMRRAFFKDARDIAQWDVQCDVGEQAELRIAPIVALIEDGRAFAALACDYHEATVMGIQGSPSFVLNDGRQKLYGNVGFRIIDANIQELLREPQPDQASWC